MRRFGPRGRGHVARPIQVWLQLGMATPLAAGHHSDLVFLKNLEGTITKSDLKLSALILHKATLLAEVPAVRTDVPRSRSDNMPTSLWIMCEASKINPLVADLHRIRRIHSRQFFLNPSFFIIQGNNIACRTMPLAVYLSHTSFLAHNVCRIPTAARFVAYITRCCRN